MRYKLVAYRRSEDIPPRREKDLFHSTALFKVYEQTSGYHPILIEVSDGDLPLARLLAVVRRSVRLFPPSIIKRCEVYGFGEYYFAESADGVRSTDGKERDDDAPEAEGALKTDDVPEAEGALKTDDAPRSNENTRFYENIGSDEDPKLESGATPYSKEEIFHQMLTFLTRRMLRRCFLIEFRNLDNALFAYNSFRQCGYFPINWLRIHNSLHSKPPYDRLSASRRRQITQALRSGATIATAETEEEVRTLGRLLRRHYTSQIRKHFPGLSFFPQLLRQQAERETGKIFVVKYKGRIIGGSVCLYSGDNAYLLFSGGLRKSHPKQYPGVLAVWAALTYAYDHGYHHMEFMDVGLPFKRHGYRDFLLRFGGAQYSTRRWFRFRWSWLNRLLTYFYI